MDKNTYIALDIVMEDIAKGRIIHRKEWGILCDWLYQNRATYFPAERKEDDIER